METKIKRSPETVRQVCARCGYPFSAHANYDSPDRTDTLERTITWKYSPDISILAEEIDKLCRQFGLINTSKKEG